MKTITLTFPVRALIDIYRVQFKLHQLREQLEDTTTPLNRAELANLLDVACKRIASTTLALADAQAERLEPKLPATTLQLEQKLHATALVTHIRHSSATSNGHFL